MAANFPGAVCTAGNCPNAVDAVNAGVGNRDQVIRNSSAILLRILPDFANANGADIAGLDLNVSYRFDTDYGTFRLGTQAAWIRQFDVTADDGAGNQVTFDGVGNYNSTNPVARPLPEWKVNGTFTWSYDNHRVFILTRYVGQLESDVPAGTRGFFAATARLAGNDSVANDLTDDKIEGMVTVDFQYNYNFRDSLPFLGNFMSDANATFGIQNLFDAEAPNIAVVTAFDGTLHDGRGRIFFARLSGSL